MLLEDWKVIVDVFCITGIVSLVFLSILLKRKKEETLKFYLYLLFIQAIFFFLLFFSINHSYNKIVGVSFLFGNGTGTFRGPLIYFLCRAYISKSKKIPRRLWFHLMPYFIKVLLYNLPISLLFIFGIKPWLSIQAFDLGTVINLIENFYFFGYIVASLLLLSKVVKLTKHEYSNLSKHDLQWLVYLIFGMLILVLLDTILFTVNIFYELDFTFLLQLIVIGDIILYLILGYKGLYQSKILLPDFLYYEDYSLNNLSENPLVKDSNRDNCDLEIESPIFTTSEIKKIKLAINKQLEEEKIFLNESLRLNDLATAIDISEKKLSQFINQELNVNFYTLINQCRVEEVKRKIISGEYEHLSILGIALESGFQSKSSFNRIFKQHTGKSPSEFRKKTIT